MIDPNISPLHKAAFQLMEKKAAVPVKGVNLIRKAAPGVGGALKSIWRKVNQAYAKNPKTFDYVLPGAIGGATYGYHKSQGTSDMPALAAALGAGFTFSPKYVQKVRKSPITSAMPTLSTIGAVGSSLGLQSAPAISRAMQEKGISAGRAMEDVLTAIQSVKNSANIMEQSTLRVRPHLEATAKKLPEIIETIGQSVSRAQPHFEAAAEKLPGLASGAEKTVESVNRYVAGPLSQSTAAAAGSAAQLGIIGEGFNSLLDKANAGVDFAKKNLPYYVVVASVVSGLGVLALSKKLMSHRKQTLQERRMRRLERELRAKYKRTLAQQT